MENFDADKNMMEIEVSLTELSKQVELNTIRLIDPATGKYHYQCDDNGKPIKGQYNLLRHFGTTWYLAQQPEFKNSQRAAINKTLRWADKYLRVKDGQAFYFYKDSIKTGGVALAILAKLACKDYSNLEQMSNFLLAQQKPSGDFVHKIVDGEDSGFESGYYTGEILFALAELEKKFPDKKRLKAICKALNYLIPLNYGVEEQSHWMLYALNAAFAVNADARYSAHAYHIVHHIQRHLEFQKRGATPIGCRIEGLLQYILLRKQEHPNDDVLHLAHSNFIEHNIGLMCNHQKNGYFLKDGICQIDYNQHCGTALRNYLNIFQAGAMGA
jgi:hypothetical protein